MKISIGADHRGYKLKQILIQHFEEYQFLDVGAFDKERSDYPIFAQKVCSDVLSGAAQVGILICGSGIGMSIAANRYKKIYAALCWNPEVACASRTDDNANILVLPADFINTEAAVAITAAWLKASFEGGRYQTRLTMID